MERIKVDQDSWYCWYVCDNQEASYATDIMLSAKDRRYIRHAYTMFRRAQAIIEVAIAVRGWEGQK